VDEHERLTEPDSDNRLWQEAMRPRPVAERRNLTAHTSTARRPEEGCLQQRVRERTCARPDGKFDRSKGVKPMTAEKKLNRRAFATRVNTRRDVAYRGAGIESGVSGRERL
jgi:hypothetical protein